MQRINIIAVLFAMLLLAACIKSYDPPIDSSAKNKYVITGCVTDQEGWQVVEISMSSPIESPSYIPISDCFAQIRDNKGNGFPLRELEPGRYRVWMSQADLTPGTAFRVQVLTPDGETLESGYDTMPRGPGLDSVYYAIEDIPTSTPGKDDRVMQFYADLDAIGDYSRYYKWEVIETFEYHAAHPGEFFYDGTFHEIKPPDYTNNVCYATVPAKNVFTISTKNLTQNVYKGYPLHAIDGNTPRLAYLYSILVRQLALSEGAYNYWEQLRINSNDQGGLYEKQPLAIKGNMKNTSTPDKDVLGYFYTASVSSKRYFYHDIEGIVLDYNNGCSEDALGRMGWLEFSPAEYPVYYYFNLQGYLRILTHECIDCRLGGGTTVKPDFWPK
jgi:hypothetical protein